MRILIIEDEKPAAEKLKKALHELESSWEPIAVLSSVSASVDWFRNQPAPDLIFMDIELSDGLSFRILEKVQINCPIIFTTAYDEYYQEAFEQNSIDYLLKPVKKDKLKAALEKYERLKTHFAANFQKFLKEKDNPATDEYRKRFLVKKGTEYQSLRVEEIAYFYATHKLVCLVDQQGRKFILDHSLADIEKQLNPEQFFRINRKFLINMNAVRKIKTHSRSKLLLELEPAMMEEVIVSQDQATAFKNWMGQ